ncbi:MAG: GNAT family N-acetyltransferase, partial [Oscillospiraceae bacterium]|nr:GNAT family N-acetyltransferase [Oscillospiraceae bacterium]
IHYGFVSVDGRRRGRGYGRELICLAARFAFQCAGAKKITLVVFDNNLAARRCYESCGFRPAETQDGGEFACMGEVWRRIKMELRPAGR